MTTCLQCLAAPAEATLAGLPVCLGCAELLIFEPARRRSDRLCSRCHGPVRGGYLDAVPVCRECASAELERAAAVELNRRFVSTVLVPALNDELVRPLPPPAPTREQVRRDLEALRARFRRDGVIVPPERSWLDD